MAASSPNAARASVRAIRTIPLLPRASTAAAIFSIISSGLTTCGPS